MENTCGYEIVFDLKDADANYIIGFTDCASLRGDEYSNW